MLTPALLILSIGAHLVPVSAQPVWEKLPVGGLHYHASAGTLPFMDYRDHAGLPANRMAGDGKGTLYLSDDSLFWMSLDNGGSWHSHRLSPLPNLDPDRNGLPAPFFAGHAGAAQWGLNWYSWDGGANWEYRSSGSPGHPLREAPAITQVKRAAFLASFPGAEDRIRNTDDSGLSWKVSHELNYYFPVLQFEAPDSQWVFGSGAQLLISRTGGTTWTNWGAASDGLFPYKISLQRADTGWTLWAIYDSSSFYGGSKAHAPKLLRYRSSGTPDSRPFSLPDSSITAFRVQDDGTLWLGTWGKGLFSSTDLGATWIARNEGLGDLRVETLYRSSEGRLFVVTPDGVFRLGSSTSALFPSPKGGKRSGFPAATSQILFRSPGDPFGYRANGRRFPTP